MIDLHQYSPSFLQFVSNHMDDERAPDMSAWDADAEEFYAVRRALRAANEPAHKSEN